MADEKVVIAVLGPVVVRGAAEPFRRPAALELAVYLAFHRGAVRHAQWSIAIWPDQPVALSTVHSTCSDCRRALGCAEDGALHLPRGVEVQLRDTVTTDVDLFATLSSSGDPLQVLRAMRLVRGPLFAGLRRSDWAVLDGTQSLVESLVVQVALAEADRSIREDRGTVAEWVVRRALRLCPRDERLHRMLLRAMDAQGNRLGLRTAMAQLRTLAGGTAPSWGTGVASDSVHPDTAALYRGLLLGTAATGADPARL